MGEKQTKRSVILGKNSTRNNKLYNCLFSFLKTPEAFCHKPIALLVVPRQMKWAGLQVVLPLGLLGSLGDCLHSSVTLLVLGSRLH